MRQHIHHGPTIYALLRAIVFALLAHVPLAGSQALPQTSSGSAILMQTPTASQIFKGTGWQNSAPAANDWSYGGYGAAANDAKFQKSGTASINGRTVPVQITTGLPKLGLAKVLLGFAKLAPIVGSMVALAEVIPDLADFVKGQTGNENIQYSRNTNEWLRFYTHSTYDCITQPGLVGRALCTTMGSGFCDAGKWAEPTTGEIFNQCGVLQPAAQTPTVETLSTDQLASRIATDSGWLSSPTLLDTLSRATDAGIVPQESPNPVQVTVPEPVVQLAPQTQTVVNPDGTTKTTTKTTTVTYTPQGDKITATETSTTTNTEPDGQTTTTQTSEAPQTPQKDPCEGSTTIGCSQFGDAPTDKRAGAQELPFTLDAVSFSSSAACPADVPLAYKGQTIVLSYKPACDSASFLKPIILAIAAFSAIAIVASAFKV